MAFDDNIIDWEESSTVTGSGNTWTNNSNNVALDVDTVTDINDSVNNSGNLGVDVDGSFNEGSNNETWNLEDSGNTGSYNDYTTITDESWTDASTNAGNREYNLGFMGGADAAEAGMGGGSGETWINNQNTVVDQSVNQNILTGGTVSQAFASGAVVASGDGAAAAGGDITVDQSLDASTTIEADGDVLIGSTQDIHTEIGSNNSTTIDVDIVSNSESWDLDNVGNEYSATLDIDNSFNDVDADFSSEDWTIDADVIWNSDVAAIGDVDVDLDI